MSKRRKQPLFELGGFWLGRESGSETIYRYWYSGRDQRVSRRSLGTFDLEEAKTRLAQLVIARPPGDGQSPESTLVTAILTHYWAHHSDHIPGGKQARRSGELLVEWLVDIRKQPGATAADFSTVWQQEFIKWLAVEKGHAVATISRTMSVIQAAMNFGLKRTVVEEDGRKREVQLLKYAVPVTYKNAEISKLTAKPEPQPRDWVPSWEQMAEFIDGIGKQTTAGPWDKNSENLFRYVVMGLNLWGRSAAILELKVSAQVNFDAGMVNLNPPGRKQTKKVRPLIPLTDNLRAWLHHWDCDLPIQRHGKSLTTIKKVFARHALKMGMPKFSPYTLRHFMATNVRRMEGCNVSREQRQEWLGHKPQDTTSWYEHYDPEWLREAKIATDKVMVRLNAMLKKRTLQPNTSQATPKIDNSRSNLKLVVSK